MNLWDWVSEVGGAVDDVLEMSREIDHANMRFHAERLEVAYGELLKALRLELEAASAQ